MNPKSMAPLMALVALGSSGADFDGLGGTGGGRSHYKGSMRSGHRANKQRAKQRQSKSSRRANRK